MKFIIVGDIVWHQYEEAFGNALESEGHEVKYLKVESYFRNKYLSSLSSYLIFLNNKINKKIIDEVALSKPDCVLFWKPTKIYISTLLKIRIHGCKVVSYNNDNAFPDYKFHSSKLRFFFKWLQYKNLVKYFDINYVYRKSDILRLKNIGSKNTKILMPYFLPWIDKPINCSHISKKKYSSDVIFIGHYENDGRDKIIRYLFDNGINVAIWGNNSWLKSKVLIGTSIYRGSGLTGEDYRIAISCSKIALCFLSKLNRDVYTRRNFEIPAVGTVVASEWSYELSNIFVDSESIIFFNNGSELISKIKFLLANQETRESISREATKVIWNGGFDVYSQAKYFVRSLDE
jgi:spore maturation protein CgeB